MIHPQTVVHPNAKIGKNVRIDAFTTIEEDVVIGDDCWIGSNATIMNGARIGNHCQIFHGAIISAPPADLKFDGEKDNRRNWRPYHHPRICIHPQRYQRKDENGDRRALPDHGILTRGTRLHHWCSLRDQQQYSIG